MDLRRPIDAHVSVTFRIAGAELATFDQTAFRTALWTQFPASRDIVLSFAAGSVVANATLVLRGMGAAMHHALRMMTGRLCVARAKREQKRPTSTDKRLAYSSLPTCAAASLHTCTASTFRRSGRHRCT